MAAKSAIADLIARSRPGVVRFDADETCDADHSDTGTDTGMQRMGWGEELLRALSNQSEAVVAVEMAPPDASAVGRGLRSVEPLTDTMKRYTDVHRETYVHRCSNRGCMHACCLISLRAMCLFL